MISGWFLLRLSVECQLFGFLSFDLLLQKKKKNRITRRDGQPITAAQRRGDRCQSSSG